MELGVPSFAAAKKAIAYFKKNGLYSAAKAVEYALVGFHRDPADDDFSNLAFCHRCTMRARATRYHMIYECPDNDNISVPIFLKTSKLAKKAKRGKEKWACYWIRGMVPYQKGS